MADLTYHVDDPKGDGSSLALIAEWLGLAPDAKIEDISAAFTARLQPYVGQQVTDAIQEKRAAGDAATARDKRLAAVQEVEDSGLTG